MASKTTNSLALFLILNILFFTTISATGHCCCSSPKPKPNPSPKPKPNPCPMPEPNPPFPMPEPNPQPMPTPSHSPSPATAKCPTDALKLGVCANVLNGLLNITLGKPPVKPCCTLIKGLVDLEAAACLCTALKANILGINLNIPLSLSLLLNVCSKKVPPGFQC